MGCVGKPHRNEEMRTRKPQTFRVSWPNEPADANPAHAMRAKNRGCRNRDRTGGRHGTTTVSKLPLGAVRLQNVALECTGTTRAQPQQPLLGSTTRKDRAPSRRRATPTGHDICPQILQLRFRYCPFCFRSKLLPTRSIHERYNQPMVFYVTVH